MSVRHFCRLQLIKLQGKRVCECRSAGSTRFVRRMQVRYTGVQLNKGISTLQLQRILLIQTEISETKLAHGPETAPWGGN